MPLSSYRCGRYQQLPNWGSSRQLLIVYSGKSSASTENHPFFGRKYQFFDKIIRCPLNGRWCDTWAGIRTLQHQRIILRALSACSVLYFVFCREYCMVLSLVARVGALDPGAGLKIIRHWQNEGEEGPSRPGSTGRLDQAFKETTCTTKTMTKTLWVELCVF